MAISDNDCKLLWGRAAGICSNPLCRQDLTVLLQDKDAYNVGEMAHVIARKPGGPRGVPEGGSDSYANLILLCPTCHRTVDKAPEGAWPAEMLHQWKSDHEAAVRQLGADRKFETLQDLKSFAAPLLAENRLIWERFGPQSEIAMSDPGSNTHEIWSMRKLDRIIPNNRRLLNAISANMHLLSKAEISAFMEFRLHAEAFEQHQYSRSDYYPLFPEQFSELFKS